MENWIKPTALRISWPASADFIVTSEHTEQNEVSKSLIFDFITTVRKNSTKNSPKTLPFVITYSSFILMFPSCLLKGLSVLTCAWVTDVGAMDAWGVLACECVAVRGV